MLVTQNRWYKVMVKVSKLNWTWKKYKWREYYSEKFLESGSVNKGIGENANIQLTLFPTKQLFFSLFSSIGQHLNLCVPTEAYINAKDSVSLDFTVYNPKALGDG